MLPPMSDETARTINILVCSCNLGNQQPDQGSLAAWIPYDGKLKDVTENQRYPVQEEGTRDSGNIESIIATIASNKEKDETEKACFDIIVIGLQEATFEVESTGAGFTGITAAKKAQRAVAGLTLAKDHLKATRQEEQTRTGIPGKNSLRGFSRGRMFRSQSRDDNDGSFSFLGNTSQGGLSKDSSSNSTPTFRPSRPWRQGSTMTSDDDVLNVSTASALDVSTSALDVATASALDVLTSSALDLSKASALDASTACATNVTGGSALNVTAGSGAPSQSDTKVLHALFQRQLPSYKHAVSYQRGQMRLMVFHNDNDIPVEVISIKAQNTGKGGLANKGGIVAEILVGGTTKLSFLTAHLEAHEGLNKYEMRCSSVADIFRGTTSTSANCRCDAALASHFAFAMGDLNFRTRFPSHEPGSESHIAAAHEMVKEKDWKRLNCYDELTNALETNQCFSGFSTALCPFPPTFKVDRGHGYVYNPKRSPSYTDRILFATGHCLRNNLKVLAYEPIDEFASSDHKPIRGAFEVKLNPRIKWRPTIMKSKNSNRAEWISNTSGFLMLAPKSSSKPVNSWDKREYLHLFVSSIQVQIDKEHYGKNHEIRTPNFFVCFISTPAEALKKNVSRWKNVKYLAATMTSVTKNLGRLEGVNAWPRTRRRKKTFHAFWDEVVRFKVHTHDSTGKPIDLSGAIIHVAVLDGSSHDLVGVFPLNLAYLVTHSRKGSILKKTEGHAEEAKSHRFRRTILSHFVAPSTRENKLDIPLKVQQGEATIRDEEVPNITASQSDEKSTKRSEITSGHMDKMHDDMDDDLMTSGPSAELLRMAATKWGGTRLTRGLMGTSSRQRKFSGASIDSMEVFSMKVNQPLRKHGVTVGRIQFTVDTWWLSDEAAARRARGSGTQEMTNDQEPQ